MNFGFTEQQLLLQDNVKKFCNKELKNLSENMEKNDFPVPKDIVKKFANLGFLGSNLPIEYGGGGLQNIDSVIILEEFAKISSAVAFPVFESSLVLLWQYIILDQKILEKDYFPKFVLVK